MDHLVATLICLGIGIVLFIVEMFTPGLGVPGFLGTIAFFAAVLLQIGNPTGIVFMIALVLFLICTGVIVFLFLVSRGKFDKSKLILKERIEGNSTDLKEESLHAYEGRVGIATTPLRPAGKADFSGKSLDVSTAGEFIPAGTSIKVARVEGLRILVHAFEHAFDEE